MSLEEALEYQKASITNIRKKAPRSSPNNINNYAEIRDENDGLMVSATLDFCVERMKEATHVIFMSNLKKG
jgi:hypothetical protein